MTRPLEGIRVLELAEQSFVPSAGAVLADWGADVVKIERPDGDPLRAVMASGLIASTGDFDYLVEQMNRNKRGVCIDLKAADGREAFERLVARSDVFITNLLPDARERLAIEPDDLFAIKADLVYARGHGQGQHGPEATAGGYDAVSFWSRGAIAHMLTEQGADRLTMQRPALGDVISGMFLAGGVSAALARRAATGEGGVVDCSLLAGAVWSLAPDLVAASVLQAEPERIDPLRLPNPLIGMYRTKDDRWLMLTMLDVAAFWLPMCAVIERPDLEIMSADEVLSEADDVRQILQEIFASRALAEWEQRLGDADCIFARVSDPVDVLDDKQVNINGYMPTHATRSDARIAASPIQFDDEQIAMRRPAPDTGEHTDEVLREAGLGAAEIEALRSSGAVR